MTEYQQKTLKPNRTEPLRFKGRIVCETEWTTRAGEWMRFAVWETQGGALIPTIEGSVPGSDDRELTAAVIEPKDDLNAMHIEVLRFYEGHHRARQMMREAGFDFIRVVP